MIQKEKVVSSLVYKFIERISVKLLGLIISIILARLIAPNDFGLLAIITVFINLSQTVIQGGFNTALVQSKTADDKDYSTVFYISLAVAGLAIGVLYMCAPFISQYYGSDALVWPLRAYAFTLVFAAFNSVQVAKLQREMKFRSMMLSSLVATVVAGVVGILMAYNGLGIWALVVYNSLTIVVSCLTMLISAKWFPRLTFSLSGAKQLFSYGWKMFVSAILCSIYNDIRTLIIGKKFSTEDLAYYNKGQQFPVVISSTLDSAIQSVMFPAMASVQDDRMRVKNILRRALSIASLLIVPLMVGLAVTAESVIVILLTEKWLPCVFYMQMICLADIVFALSSSNLVAIKAIGRSDIYMRLEIVRRILMLVVLAVSLLGFHSVEAVVIGYLISSWLDYIVITVPVKKLLNYGIFQQIRDIWKILLASACVGAVAYAISFVEMHLVLQLCLQVLAGVLTYLFMCWLLKIESFIYLKDMLFKKFIHRKK